MTLAKTFTEAGTVTLTAGSKEILGAGTNWQTAGVSLGDWFVSKGELGYIESVTDNENLILKQNWTGKAGNEQGYLIERRGDSNTIVANQIALSKIIRQLDNGLFVEADAFGSLKERSIHDEAAKNFVYRVTDDSSGDLISYVKSSDADGDWAGPFKMRGKDGTNGKNGKDGKDGKRGGPGGFNWTFTGQQMQPSTGSLNQIGLNLTNGDLWRKEASGWNKKGSLRGPKGEDGAIGMPADQPKLSCSFSIVDDRAVFTARNNVGGLVLTDDNKRVNVPQTGLWLVTVLAKPHRYRGASLFIHKNGVREPPGLVAGRHGGGGSVSGSCLHSMNEGDYVELATDGSWDDDHDYNNFQMIFMG